MKRQPLIGISIPNGGGVEDAEDLISLAVEVEELGFASVWVTEHLLNVAHIRDRIGSAPYYHPLSILSYLAARTSTITLGTSVVVLPFHHPVDLAKYAATLDRLSGGRLVLGFGAGGVAAEFDALGLPFRERGAITDEALAVMTTLWREDPANHSGQRWNLTDVTLTPRAIRKGGVTTWSGGAGVAARRRAATTCDGWQPNGITPEEFRAGVEDVRERATAAGRDPAAITMSVRLNIEMAGAELPSVVDRRSVLTDDPSSMIKPIREFAEHGAEHVVLSVNTADLAAVRVLLRRIADEVLPEFA